MASATTINTPRINLNLSSNDAAVLQALFDNGEGSFSSSAHDVNPYPNSSSTVAAHSGQNARIDASLPSFPQCSIREETALQSLKDRELAIVRQIQSHAHTRTSSNPHCDEEAVSHVLRQAIDDLSSLITERPDYPPLYANRAQALRILMQSSSTLSSSTKNSDKDIAIFYPENINMATQLLSDLSKAIALASPPSTGDNTSNTSVSPAQARLLSNTYTHRGYILLKAGKIRKEEEEGEGNEEKKPRGGPEQLLRITSRDELEEMASQDFFQAGRYGNEVGKQLSVQTNPYAKMCGAIVKEALKKEIEEFQS
ncbi:hypothetical protein UA08_08520 [Talaromyces atroroseus]|uniref:Tetratricopeptide repeat protein 36 n=1 Tax=Talaromyces atroroseus TaxID=1441469 RepID=A0A1Q5Q7Q5_TALAT|nr:hypothetical protein UA08_08520 [Talaromyces atroroseus]OKL56248.1 hypothetical protein UA08_08520 [Talaromyces atroroseus]